MEFPKNSSWFKFLSAEFERPYFIALKKRIDQEIKDHQVLPSTSEIFNAFKLCPIENVKVVILGQDPYPTPGHAHGLCFSVPDNIQPIAKSLKNIFKELRSDLGAEPPLSGNLEHWASQGVLLLNTVLTVNAHEANSHKMFGWQKFTDQVINTVSKEKEGVIFMLWGSQAQKKSEIIDSSKHYLLTSVHPSPLSAYRGFFGCKHFSKANELLVLQQKKPINW